MPRHAIVIAVDGLRASALGAYGNTWYATPALDALASQSLLFDWMYCQSPALEEFYRSIWHAGNRSLIRSLLDSGVTLSAIADDRQAAQYAAVVGFADVDQVATYSEHAAETVAETHLAQLLAVALDRLDSWSLAASEPAKLLWLHSRGFHGPWDAPAALREQLLDEDDPPPLSQLQPPRSLSTQDPDELLQYRAAYAAQAIVLDQCIGAFVEALTASRLARETMVIVIGTRGFGLGEHGLAGTEATALYSELLHVPCLVRFPCQEGPAARSASLICPADIADILDFWFTQGGKRVPCGRQGDMADFLKPRQFVTAAGAEDERMIRTPAWMLRSTPSSLAAPTVELYVKPDDKWEANEVAQRRPDVAERLLAVLNQAGAGPHGEQGASEEPLEEELVVPSH
jgi:hypothetical protein